MTNTGYWNMDLAVLYLFLFTLPLLLKCFLWVYETYEMNKLSQMPLIDPPKDVEIPVQIVEIEKPVYKEKIVYRDKPVEKTVAQPQKREKPTTNKDIILDVIAGLLHLGYSKKDAKTIVKTACDKKIYEDADSLLKDCLSIV